MYAYPDCYGSSLPDEGGIGAKALNRACVKQGKPPIYYIGNKKSKIYHATDCYCVNMMLPDHIETVENREDEHGRFYRACSKCLPYKDMEDDFEKECEEERL